MKKLLLLPLLLLLGFGAGAQCVASFTSAVSNSGNALLQRQFTNTSAYGALTGNQIPAGHINYGDGSSANLYYTGGTALHNYSAPGTYTVGLRISKLDSSTYAVICTDSTTQVITVGYTPCGSTMSIVTGNNGAKTFTANTPAGTAGMTYSWSFGDGNTGTGSPITHTYANNGSYTVTLTATGGGCTYTNTLGVVVSNALVSCANLHAQFSTSLYQNVATFTNLSTNIPGFVRVNSYNYGDGTPVSATPNHTYTAVGTYTVKLKVLWVDSVTQGLYCQDSITHTITISSVPTPPNVIYGFITWDSLANNFSFDTFKVMLIQFNPTTNILSAVDSLLATGNGGAGFQFNNKPAGNYLVKAIPLGVASTVQSFVPTYHDSSLYWNLAQTIVHAGGVTPGNIIYIRTGIPVAGPGFVGGNVSLGANKGASGGVPGMNIILRNASNHVVATTLTDGNGDYQFLNVPVGTYSVYPEALNFATTSASNLSVTATFPSVIGVFFNQDNSKMSIKPRGLGVGTLSATASTLSIAPNPASKAVVISWKGATASGARLIITNTTGQVVLDKAVTNASAETLNVSELQPGIYFLRATQGLAGTAQKLVIE